MIANMAALREPAGPAVRGASDEDPCENHREEIAPGCAQGRSARGTADGIASCTTGRTFRGKDS
jgi:hypothetical protein